MHCFRHCFKIALLFVMILNLGACASKQPEILTEREYYEKAKSALSRGNFGDATRHLEALETYHPFGRYAEQAQLELIYARYNALDNTGAEAAADRFIKLHPDSANVDYAYYLKGVSAYYADLGMQSRYLPVDPGKRDMGRAREAFRTFETLVTRFPDSPYAPDAVQRMIALQNRLARYELHVADYYTRREALVAALNRVKYVVENYPESSETADALAMQIELLYELGLKEQASKAHAVLAANFPTHRSLEPGSLAFRGGMLNRVDRDLSTVLELGISE